MQVITGDLWNLHRDGWIIVIPTNLVLARDGQAVMGKGMALAAKTRFPGLPAAYGRWIAHWRDITGDSVPRTELYYDPSARLVCLPTKTHWRFSSDPQLIQDGLEALVRLFPPDESSPRPIGLPLLGCGLGQLSRLVVEPLMAGRLDDRFTLVLAHSTQRG